MNVADSNSDGNPTSGTDQAAQSICRQIDQFAEALKPEVEEAAGDGQFTSDSLRSEVLSRHCRKGERPNGPNRR